MKVSGKGGIIETSQGTADHESDAATGNVFMACQLRQTDIFTAVSMAKPRYLPPSLFL